MRLLKYSGVAARIITGCLIIYLGAVSAFSREPVPSADAEDNEKTYYFLTDHLGSVDAVLDEQGNVVERRDYLPYGSQRAAETFNGVPITDLGFTGKELDDETGLNYYGARYYDPVTGRFITMDPLLLNLDKMSQAQRNAFLSNPQNLNMYSYAQNNPIVYNDPTGLYVMKTGEVEKDDTMTSITGELNDYFGTGLTPQQLATINSVSDPDKIQIGQIIKMGTINADGSVWQRAYDPSEVTIGYWNGLNTEEQRITHSGRNLFQDDLPPIEILAITSGNYDNIGSATCHNLGIGVYGNQDYRGTGSSEGQQAIYDANGKLVTSYENMGTYDFETPTIKNLYTNHLTVDVQPWIEFGNSPFDTTTKSDRINTMGASIQGRFGLEYLGY
ncbi:LysM peptidoglycan-binding domain-containing protein [Patescibacteria group bacterium]|nr:LysM peptidoglycan-binding domain-containing protein [Patescibacteria group bacterium]MBU1015738.1 LysM peptidoglycan-binding domain-containing protein [Patescibacteria group bacterium]